MKRVVKVTKPSAMTPQARAMKVTRSITPTSRQMQEDNPLAACMAQEARVLRSALVVLDKQMRVLQTLRDQVDAEAQDTARSMAANPAFRNIRTRTGDIYNQLLGAQMDATEILAALDSECARLLA